MATAPLLARAGQANNGAIHPGEDHGHPSRRALAGIDVQNKYAGGGLAIEHPSLGITACGGGDDSENSRSDHLFYQQRAFDLQAHRGGLSLEVESSVASFCHALQMGVNTLELDRQITKDDVAVVTHDRKIPKNKCLDTAPASADDPLFPYVGRYIKDLTLAQVKTMDCGSLMLVRKLEPSLPIVALTNGQQFLQAGKEGASPWLGGLDIDDFQGDLVAAAQSFGADAISPVHGDPQGGHYGDTNYKPYTTRDLVQRAHAVGMKVIPWTVSDESTMKYLIDAKVDGFITDLPDLARSVMQANGLSLPKPVAKQ